MKVCCGVGTDHLDPAAGIRIDDIIRAYEEQIEAIEAMGGQLVVMASRALAATANSPDDYAKVYGRILGQVREPVMIHWLGEMFDPALAGYWGAADHAAAMENCLGVIRDDAARVDGVKISLLSKEKEIEMRRKLPSGVRMYTGDDFNYAELIAGDEEGYSDALLGIFDAIAPAASAGLARLSAGDLQGFHGNPRADSAAVAAHLPGANAILQNGRRVSGLAQWLAGSFHYGRRAGKRPSLLHLAELFRLADKARVLHDPELAAAADGQIARGARAGMNTENLSINLATVRQQWNLREAVEACARHRHHGGRSLARPGRRYRARASARVIKAMACESAAIAAAACFRRPTRPGEQAAIDDNMRAIDEASALGAECLILVVGGLPKGTRDIAARAGRWWQTASPQSCRTPAPPTCRSRSNRCIRCTRRTAPA